MTTLAAPPPHDHIAPTTCKCGGPLALLPSQPERFYQCQACRQEFVWIQASQPILAALPRNRHFFFQRARQRIKAEDSSQRETQLLEQYSIWEHNEIVTTVAIAAFFIYSLPPVLRASPVPIWVPISIATALAILLALDVFRGRALEQQYVQILRESLRQGPDETERLLARFAGIDYDALNDSSATPMDRDADH